MKEFERLRQLAESGDGPANLELGIALWGDQAYGPLRNTPRDFSLAVKYFRTAAEMGQDQAYLYLERAYKSGRGVEKNRKIARHWRSKYEQLDHVREYEHRQTREKMKVTALAAIAAVAGLAYGNYVQSTRIWWICVVLALITGASAAVNSGLFYRAEAERAKRSKLEGHDPSTTDAEGYRYYRSTAAKLRVKGFSFVMGAAALLCAGAFASLAGLETVTIVLNIAALPAGGYGAFIWWDTAQKLKIIERDEKYRARERDLYETRTAADNSIPEELPITPTAHDTI